MPSSEDDGEIRIPVLDRPRHFHRFPDHRPGHQRNPETKRIFDFVHDALFVVGLDRRVNDADFVPCVEQRRRDRQNAEGSCRLNTGKGGNKEHDLFG